jgi:hypothetical protein
MIGILPTMIALSLPRLPADPIVTGVAVGLLVVGLMVWLVRTRA